MTLRELMTLHDAGKLPGHLIDHYETKFSYLREKEITLLELGVDKGGSLKMWRDYFPKAGIVGLDLRDPLDLGERISCYRGRQEDSTILRRIASIEAPEGFDIIIDDCSHSGFETKQSFMCLFYDHLKHGGIYSIEDYGTSYEHATHGGATYRGRNHNHGIVALVKDLIDWTITKTDERIESIEIFQENCFIVKR